MSSICYYYNHGILCAVWPGKSVHVQSLGCRKEGQLYLGKVIDKDKKIFWTRARGYYTFDPDTQAISEPPLESLPQAYVQPDGRRRYPPVIVDFGDSFFLDQLLRGIQYDKVIENIDFKNKDSFYALLSYYVLENTANSHAESWIHQNYASYLYPKANLASQRISDMLLSIGRDDKIREFLKNHIAYVLESTNEDVSVIIDSSGFENKCDLSVTKYSNHNGDLKLEFRMIAVIQKTTGIPLYYECIPGNIVDVSTLDRLILTLSQYNCNVQYCIGDAGYCCPSIIERLILSGIEFMTRINPHFNIYKKVVEEHYDELSNDSNIVRYKNRFVHVVKIQEVIGTDKTTEKNYNGFVYLCKDIQSSNSKTDHLLSSNKIKNMTTEEVVTAQKRFGVFAIISTRDLPPEEVLPEYYIRQKIEQYFDFGKNYAKYIPIRQHNFESLKGHLLISFISVFIIILIKNRLNIIDSQYTCVPNKVIAKEKTNKITEIDTGITNSDGNIILQDPLQEIFKESPSALFSELRGQKADVYTRTIIPTIATSKAKKFYQSFGLSSPFQIKRNDEKLDIEYKNKPNGLTKILAFSQKPCISDDEIIKKRNKIQQNLQSSTQNIDLLEEEKTKTTSNEIQNTNETVFVSQEDNENIQNCVAKNTAITSTKDKQQKKRGRPPGRKNKKTLEKEAQIRDGLITVPPKNPVGRPPGRKNKKTLEREEKNKAESQTSGTASDAESEGYAKNVPSST